ncbi:helix-turn-helix transcriptional regulator [Kitasatospora sp. NPDC091276]|uniref:helix-turn-helix transcriptional regulator n=1 Tax=unclassified Kitasatospora TaxID=2633591 RepID=UPI003447D807
MTDTAITTLPGTPLTRSELRVLRLLANGRTTDQAARHLYVSRNTVNTHIYRIYRKLGAVDRAHAVALGIATEQLDPSEITVVHPIATRSVT